ncbi:MAG: 3-deoxy-D-manno-octulosonic acid transferase [Rickettsiales bacterium]|jgi:3-deoxy-D-manno-octulosonic-acid transferase|nr:3-deoxy-D-manno-octulosonic acid transferase [Rickettsiales bacterium]
MYQIYKFISILIYPLIRILLLKRVDNGKEDPDRYVEKLGFFNISRPSGKLIWFHAASIGEFNAILPIIRSISSEFPSINILVTTVTITAAKIAKNNLPRNAIHQFAPLDCHNIVKRFIDYWQPNLSIWTESEFWPNMLVLASNRTKLVLINARLSEKSFSRWRCAKPLAKSILGLFSLILTQNRESKVFIEKLGVKNVIESGNLKFIAENFSFNSKEIEAFKKQVEERPVVMAASTHPGEEDIFIQIQKNLQEHNLLTIIAPRHPIRTEEVLNLLQKSNLNFITRSSKEKITNNTDVLLVDTLGEFGLFYRLSNIVCIGGSWTRIGHNFIEPAKLRNIIIFGPNMDNSREVSDLFLNKKAAISAKNTSEIQKLIENYILNPQDFYTYQDNAENTVNEMNKIKDVVMNYIRPYINKIIT